MLSFGLNGVAPGRGDRACGGVSRVSLVGNHDRCSVQKLRKIANLTEFLRKCHFLRRCQAPNPYGGVVLEIEGKIQHVQQVALAGKSKKAYIPTPLKRWNGIGVQPRLLNRVSYATVTMFKTLLIVNVQSKNKQKCCTHCVTMQLSTCKMVAARVPQGNRRNERSTQLIGG